MEIVIVLNVYIKGRLEIDDKRTSQEFKQRIEK